MLREPSKIVIKKWYVYFRYNFTKTRKRLPSIIPWCLFAVSILLFISVMIPNFLNRTPVLGEWPIQLELNGSIYISNTSTEVALDRPVGGAKIDIGGYNTYSNSQGRFDIIFSSKTKKDIPVLIQCNGICNIFRISFDDNRYSKNEVFKIIEE